MSHVTVSVRGIFDKAAPFGYVIFACGVSWRPGQRVITPARVSRTALCTAGRLDFGVPSA